MVDFILRHGNDLLAVECLRGFEVSLFLFFFQVSDIVLFFVSCLLNMPQGMCGM